MPKRHKPRIGATIRKRRLKLGMTASELARQCNVTRVNVYLWEASSYILRKHLPAIAKALDLSLPYLTSLNGTSPWEIGRKRPRDRKLG